MVGKIESAQILSDTLALIGAIDALGEERVARRRFGVIGYCMGGRLGFLAAASLPDRVAALASLHGGGLVTDKPDSPHLKARSIRAALYLGVADEDPSCTPAHQAALKAALEAAGVRHELEFNPGARHGYAVLDAASFHPTAAERAWERVLALFAEHLRPHIAPR
jgi:carboxymethylenebutenolidase